MSISFSLQATKLVSELTILYSQTRWELWLKTELSILTSNEALRRWGLFITTENITLKRCYVPKVLFNRRFCFEIVQFSEFLTQSETIFR